LKDLNELIDILNQNQSIQQNLIYRLYHDSHGNPMFYSMEDLPGNYIDITAEQFSRANSHVRVINGQLKEKSFSQLKLIPSDSSGQSCCVGDVTIVVDSQNLHRKWELKYYE